MQEDTGAETNVQFCAGICKYLITAYSLFRLAVSSKVKQLIYIKD